MLCVFKTQSVLINQLEILKTRMELVLSDHRPSAIHALRVATRRADAAIFLCQDSLGRRAGRLAFKRCRQIRKHSNQIRNCDVTLGWLETNSAEPHAKRRLHARRRREYRLLTTALTNWLKDEKMRPIQQLASSINRFTLDRNVAFRTVQLAGQYVYVSARGISLDRQLHPWRIATKRLRYALEFLQTCDCIVDLAETLGTLERLQTTLGEATDGALRHKLAVAQEYSRTLATEPTEHTCWLRQTPYIFNKVVEAAYWCLSSDEGMI